MKMLRNVHLTFRQHSESSEVFEKLLETFRKFIVEYSTGGFEQKQYLLMRV